MMISYVAHGTYRGKPPLSPGTNRRKFFVSIAWRLRRPRYVIVYRSVGGEVSKVPAIKLSKSVL
jgi:hypothetical protein